MISELQVLLDNLRSNHNVGSIFRTADAFGVNKIILTGYTPYPSLGDKDKRRKGVQEKATKDIAKTALGAEKTVQFEYCQNPVLKIKKLKAEGFKIIALENNVTNPAPIKISELHVLTKPKKDVGVKICLILGAEVEGIAKNVLKISDQIVEIPMSGKKESLNVSVAFGIAVHEISRKSY